MIEATPIEQDVVRTFDLLGGKETISTPVRNSMEAHDLLMTGLPTLALLHLIERIDLPSAESGFEKAIGISLRTLQRRRKDAATNLSVEQGNRTWKFAEILGRATEVFGSKEEAEAWMTRPAIGLDQRKPLDLMATTAGVEAVEDYLTRIEFGVYT
jgi:putative toxin-antitoxin system antitoxin component (TIGR02293 family)